MTMVPPTIVPLDLTGYPSAYRSYPDVQPFSQRSALTFQQKLESIAAWIPRVLVPFLSDNLNQLDQDIIDGLNNLADTVNLALSTQAGTINDALALQRQQVADNLQQTLNDITSGESAALNDSVIYQALQVANSQALGLLDGRYIKQTDGWTRAQADARYQPIPTAFGFYLIQGTGIDLTGVADSTAAVNALVAALPAGSSVRVPSGAVINMTDTLQIATRIHLHGDGELRWTAGIASKAMIHVTADGCNLDGLYLTNPNHLAAQAPASRTYGIFVEANSVRTSGNRIVGQQQAICVSAVGEYHDFIINGNIILDVPGSGDGASSGTSNGEDRGDGIVVWGATAVIAGNRVAALAGTDARIGIHTESLPGSEGTAYVHGDQHTIIGNNIVTGKFRRSITSEGVAFCTIVGNTLADATWWGINLSNTAHNCIVADNTINWTRTSTDNQGSAWTPNRGGIMVYDQVQNAKVRGNIITVASGAVMPNGIIVQASANDTAHKSQNVSIEGNRISDPAWGIVNGINVPNGATALRILNNDIDGFTGNGVNAQFVDDISVTGNRLTGNSASITAKGVLLQASSAARSTWAKVNENVISYTTTALALFNRTVFVVAVANVIRQASVGIDFFDSTTAVATINSNTFISTTTKLANVPTTNVQIGNN